MASDKYYKDLRNYLIDVLDKENRLNVAKVDRYISLLKLFDDLDKDIEKHGRVIGTKNGSQNFVKQNPALDQKTKINIALSNIEESFGIHRKLKDKADENQKSSRRRKMGDLIDSS